MRTIEAPAKRGATSLLATMLTKDTRARNAAQVARFIEEIGIYHPLDDYDIVRTYGAEYRGVVNYYLGRVNLPPSGELVVRGRPQRLELRGEALGLPLRIRRLPPGPIPPAACARRRNCLMSAPGIFRDAMEKQGYMSARTPQPGLQGLQGPA